MSTKPQPITITWRIIDAEEAEQGEIVLDDPDFAPADDDAEADAANRPGSITIETDPTTAAEIRSGSLSPQHALLLGRIVVSADPATLLAASSAIAADAAEDDTAEDSTAEDSTAEDDTAEDDTAEDDTAASGADA